MIRMAAPILVSVGLALGFACGDAKQAGNRGLAPHGLESHLLSPADVAEGWSLGPYNNVASSPGLCGHAQAAVLDGRAAGAAAIQLHSPKIEEEGNGRSRQSVVQTLVQKDEAEARRLVDEVRTQVSACTAFDLVQGDARLPIHVVLSDLSVTLVGDERVAYRATASFVGLEPIASTVHVETAIVRRGGVVMALSLTRAEETSDANDVLFSRVLEAAYKKLDGLQGATTMNGRIWGAGQ